MEERFEELEETLENLKEAIVQGRKDKTVPGLEKGMEGEPGVAEITSQALKVFIKLLMEPVNQGMEEVGKRFGEGFYFLPDMLAAGEAVGFVTEFLEPLLAQSDEESRPKFVIATVEGDQHSVGKNIISLILKGAGFTVIDLGVDVSMDTIIERVEQEEAQLLGLSALLLETMPRQAEIIKKIKEKGLRVKVIVGGAQVTPEWAEEIGADDFSSNQESFFLVAEKAKKLLQDLDEEESNSKG